MSGFDSVTGMGQGFQAFEEGTAPSIPTTTQPPSAGSNRDSLNLDDFEKVEADQLLGGPTSTASSGDGKVAESTQAAAVDLVEDIMAKVTNSGQDLFSNFTSTGLPSASETKVVETSPVSDPFKMDDDIGITFSAPPTAPSTNTFAPDSTSDFTGGVPASESFTADLLASAPPPPSTNVFDDLSPRPDDKKPDINAFEDFLSKHDDPGMQNFTIPEFKETVKDVSEPLFDTLGSQPPLSAVVSDPSPVEPVKRDPSPDFKNPTPPRTPTAPSQVELSSPKQPTPPRTPTPPPREPTPPPPREPTPPPVHKQPTPPRTPTPPPREPTPPPKVPTPTPRVPTPPPREPTPPPREPTPPPREPTPPPREPTPPPREPTPPPREPTPPPPRKVTPPAPRTPTPPPVLVKEVPSAPLQEAKVTSPSKSYTVSTATKNAFNVFKPRAWFNPDQLDPRVVDLIYWRDVKKTGIMFGSLMVILLSLAYLSLISVVAYTSLAVLTGTITFRVYKNIMQAVQKSQDGHPFKSILELDTDLPSDKVHEATDVIVSQINSTISELKRLFLVEDLVDSVKFGCLLWCLTYLGSWFNGLTLVILAVVALFSLPKVYEQNQTQIDQYVGLVRSQVNDVMSKVKAALPIGNKEKTQ